MNIFDFINIIVGFQLIFIALFLLLKKNNALHNKLIAAFLLSKSLVYIHIVSTNILHAKVIIESPFLSNIHHSFMYVLHPIIYFYTKSHLDFQFKLKLKHLLHALPFLFMLFHYQLNNIFYNYHTIGPYLTNYLFLVQAIIYLSSSVILVLRHKKSIKNNKREQDKIVWLQIVLYCLLFLWIVYSVTNIIRISTNSSLEWIQLFIELLFFVILLGLIYTGLNFGYVFNLGSKNKKYTYSRLNKLQKKIYSSNLEEFMINKKLFLDPELSIEKMANQLNISNRDLSQIVNEEKNMNFNEFINSFRLKESIKLLEDKAHAKKTIQEILFESGFNSKSAFYDAFGKHTGMTPTEYRRQLKNDS